MRRSALRTRWEHLSSGRLGRLRSLWKYLAGGLAVVLLLLAFVRVASEVIEGDTHGIDTTLLREAKLLRDAHPVFAHVMRDLSGLGSTTVLSFFTAATAGYLLLVSARVHALVVVAAALSGAALISLLKPAFGRMRPDAALADFTASGLSFPSGHASMSAAVFLTLGVISASTRTRLSERLYILAVAAAAAVLVGLSRIALGVHWASDVLGGWALGAAWALGWSMVAFRLLRAR
ncbi:phosphatase PAP2 family protein [Variovorax sp. J22P271]|uniref:phosphatase PAP2 family protein n=1 Tax=Variovorax davisae TaxID=3053515 RepID=UPI00257562FD|nr:phosphatase PAP2 family protein [Variovorax sp. J22P271]MDM0035769.1 phosphatase PAP2 family protein [Variovorax sp. J22P271]